MMVNFDIALGTHVFCLEKMDNSERRTCVACKGAKEVTVNKITMYCSHCDGDGYKYENVLCPKNIHEGYIVSIEYVQNFIRIPSNRSSYIINNKGIDPTRVAGINNRLRYLIEIPVYEETNTPYSIWCTSEDIFNTVKEARVAVIADCKDRGLKIPKFPKK